MCIYISIYILGRIFLEWISMDFLILNENKLFRDFFVSAFCVPSLRTHNKSADKPPHFQVSCKKLVIRTISFYIINNCIVYLHIHEYH